MTAPHAARPHLSPLTSRRGFSRALGAGAAATAATAAGLLRVSRASAAPAAIYAAAPAAPDLVRIGSVNTPDFSGLLDELLADFTALSGMRTTVYSGEDVYEHARAAEFDLILSHYGHKDVEAFMADGLGQWPRTVFANQVAIVGPAADPAGVAGLTDATEAFRRIAASGAVWMVNNLPGLGYLEAVLWEGAGRPAKGDWFVDTSLAQAQAIQQASRRGAYTLWGIFPFLRLREQQALDLEPLVLADSLLQRVMVTILPEPRRLAAGNDEGAAALQQFLLTPATQARIRAFRYPGRSEQLWWPAARHNHPSVLPDA